MKLFATAFFILTLFTANAQLYIDTVKQGYGNTHGGQYPEGARLMGVNNLQLPICQWVYKAGEREEGDTLPVRFKIDTLTQKAFDKFEKNYRNAVNFDSSAITRTDSSFIIKTQYTQDTFNTEVKELEAWYYYKGFIEYLNLYAVQGIDGHNEIGWFTFIDKKTGKSYSFESPSDYPIEDIFVSPAQSYLLGYVNDLYDDRGFISILKVNKGKSSFTLEDFYGLYIENTVIQRLVWIDESSFAIAVADLTLAESYERTHTNHYLKITFK